MALALQEAEKAYKLDEVPVGALIVGTHGEVLAKAHNLKESQSDPCGHAEILAIRKAAEKLGSWRLTGCSLYVTLEPCMMCLGAAVQSRLKHINFGASDPKAGFVLSMHRGLEHPHNHLPTWTQGTLGLECSKILKNFFKSKR
jgi:tRNA(adenine34) deaminase